MPSTRRMTILASSLVAGLVSVAASADAKDEVIATSGNWKVLRTKELMTDKLSCFAIYATNAGIQLYRDSFYISYRGRGGVETYQMRFDDTPATPVRLATQNEKDLGAIKFSLKEVQRLVKSKRLRVAGLTLLNTLIEEDLDLGGIADAHGTLTGQKCK